MNFYTAVTSPALPAAYNENKQTESVYFLHRDSGSIACVTDAHYNIDEVGGPGGFHVLTSHQTCKRYPLIADDSAALEELYGLVAIPAVLAKMKELKADGRTRGSTFKQCLGHQNKTQRHNDLVLRILRYEFEFGTREELNARILPVPVPSVTPNRKVSQSQDEALMECLQSVTKANQANTKACEVNTKACEVNTKACEVNTKASQANAKACEANAKASQANATCITALAGQFEVLTVKTEKIDKQVKRNTEGLEVCSEELSVLRDRMSQVEVMLHNSNINTGAPSNVAAATATAPRVFCFGVSDDKKQDRKVGETGTNSNVAAAATPRVFSFGVSDDKKQDRKVGDTGTNSNVAAAAAPRVFSVGVSDNKKQDRKARTLEQRRDARKGVLLGTKTSKARRHGQQKGDSKSLKAQKGDSKSLKARRANMDRARKSPLPVARNLFPLPFSFMPKAN